MSVHKDPQTGKWEAHIWYRDSEGVRRRKHKRGFETKKGAETWSTDFKVASSYSNTMTLAQFTKVYEADRRPRLRLNTWLSKEYVIKNKILPYLGSKLLNSITPRDVMRWQNKLIRGGEASGRPYSKTYLRTIHSQLTAILNHACRFYGLKDNPATKAGSMGEKNADGISFWTREEYAAFAKVAKFEPIAYHAFEILYWTGIRLGELLVLTSADIDFEKQTISISKSYQRIRGEDVVTGPKTLKGRRVVAIPAELCRELEQFVVSLDTGKPDDRLFTISKGYLSRHLKQNAQRAELKPIRVHDLRHSHVSLLIDLGFSAVAIAERLGHGSIEVPYRYAHLFPHRQTELVDRLNKEMKAVS